ncbi:MAG: gliding motility-associated C-terminal domain-containing protein [Flavobacteriales bacterium]|nr:gliding motility-associated C-terminal domain-containing protein [Flavobacteriales bacterium]
MRVLKTVFSIFLVIQSWNCFAISEPQPTQSPDFLFEENKGQFHENVLFRCRLPNGYLFLERARLTYLFQNQDDKRAIMEAIHEHDFDNRNTEFVQRQHSIKIDFINADNTAKVQGFQPENYYHNYFVGSNRSNWATEVKLYKRVVYKNIYPNVDLVFYTDANGTLKYDWKISNGGKAENIRLKFDGHEQINLVGDSLFVHTSCGNLIETPPILKANNEDEKLPACHFSVSQNELSYCIENQQNLLEFVIDPALIFSTYSGSRGDNFGFTATYDSRSHLYAGGITDGDQGNYPVTTGAFQTTYGGGLGRPDVYLSCDISISKYDSAGTTLLWATYLGGADDDYPHSLVVNQDDELYVMGTTYSKNFPMSLSGYDTSYNGNADIIISKLSADGKKLLGSTYIGGSGIDGLNRHADLRYNYADDFRGDIIPDENKNVYVASCTRSSDFPLIDAVDSTIASQEGCFMQFNSDLSVLKWSSFLGGSKADALYSIKVDLDSSIYVGGGTSSDDIETTSNAFEKNAPGNVDGYVAVIDRKNKKITSLSYWGTSQYDQIYFIDLNKDFGNVFVAGQTTGNINPSAGVYGQPNKSQFIAKLEADLSNLKWQTSFGARDNQVDISPSAFLVDNCEHIYMSGWGSNTHPDMHPGSTANLPISSNAVQKTTDDNDFYLLVLDKDAQSLLYATYFGGDSSHDHVDGGTSRFDKRGVVYQSVCSSCPQVSGAPGFQDFPVTPNAAFTKNVSPRCSNASFKIDLQIRTDVDAYFVPNPVLGCSPLTVNFDNRSRVVQKFIWDFGDGTKDSTSLNPFHVYTEPGDYEITLTVIDSNTCNISDIFKRQIKVLGNPKAAFEFEIDPCSYEVQFETNVEAIDYFWNLGDGNTETKQKFNYQFEPGSANFVTLYVNKGTVCEDSITKEINVANAAARDVFIPNIFTPNGDKLNDFYCIDGLLNGCDKFEIWIYNRWGERVFHTTDMNECWDGKSSSSAAIYPGGTYFYIIQITEAEYSTISEEAKKKYKISGVVTLVGE